MNKIPAQIAIYRSAEGAMAVDVRLEKNTVWLTQKQIAELFGTQRPAITKHLGNIFKAGELSRESVCSILEHTAADGKKYSARYYNLDAIISVGYRVNSKRATQFRIWATNVLKKYLVQGYAVNAVPFSFFHSSPFCYAPAPSPIYFPSPPLGGEAR